MLPFAKCLAFKYIYISFAFFCFLYKYERARCLSLMGVIVIYIYIQSVFAKKKIYAQKAKKNYPFYVRKKYIYFKKYQIPTALLSNKNWNFALLKNAIIQ